jgi:hypothetical protein
MKLSCACGKKIFVDTSDEEKAWNKIIFAQSFSCKHIDNAKSGKHNFNIWGWDE